MRFKKPAPPKDILEKQYKALGMKVVAECYGISVSKVKDWLIEYNVPIDRTKRFRVAC